MVSPPYDQFNPALEKIFFNKSPYNIAHLILPKPEGLKTLSGVEGDSWAPYQRVRAQLKSWLGEEIILPDGQPTLYAYRITYKDGQQQRQNLGFFALGKLEEYLERGVSPHENILAAPREDRLKLRISTQADFGPVYMLYRDSERALERMVDSVLNSTPLVEVRDMAGELHQLWSLTEPAAISKVVSLLDSKPVLIADGHHRYDAALESFRRNPDLPWFAYRMMAFFNSEGGGLSIRPIHRILSGLHFSSGELVGRLGANFEVEVLFSGGSEKDFSEALDYLAKGAENQHRIGVLLEDNFYLLAAPRTESLDVEVLDGEVFKSALGLREEDIRNHVDYSKDAWEVAGLVGLGKAKAGFILNPTRMEEIWKKVEAGKKLPPKSTFFYPKLLTGLVMSINPGFYFHND